MKYLIGLLCLFSVAQAQFAPTSAKSKFVNGIGIGSKDTSQFTAADTIALTIARDSVMYYRYRGFWRPIATGGNLSAYKLISDTLFANGYTTRARLKQGLDSLAATKVNISDTASMLAPYFRDSDTTGLLNQVVRTFGAQTVFGIKAFGDSMRIGAGLSVLRIQADAGISLSQELNIRKNTNSLSTDFLKIGTSVGSGILYGSYIKSTSNHLSFTGNDMVLGVTNTSGNNVDAISISSAGVTSINSLSTAGIVTNTSAGVLGTTSIVPIANGGTGSSTQNFVDLTTSQTITGQKTFNVSGNSGNVIINHGSGSGVALNITKGGNGEGLIVNKTSGSGNAATITGTLEATTLVKNGGTSSQFLKADGSVDNNTYTTTSQNALKLNISDTAAMLLPYTRVQRFTDSLTNVQSRIQTKQNILTLTTTGTSGAATLVGSTLNIPQYQSVLTNPVTGTGTTNYLPKFTGSTTVGNSNLINDASGNLGLGVTPSAWRSGDVVIDLGATTSLVNAQSQNTRIYTNAFVASGGTNTYKTTNFATYYDQGSGQHRWFNAPSGTAGNAITFTQAMTLDASGNLFVGGTTNPYSLGRLIIAHNSSFSRTYFQRDVNLIEIIPSNGTLPNQISSSYTSSGSAYMPLSLSARQNSADLYLSTSGNVLIGTTTDAGYKLDVNGTGRFSGALTGTSASFSSTLNVDGTGLINISYPDISTGANKGLRIVNTDATEGTAYNITSGRTGVNNGDFVIRNTTTGVNNLVFNRTTGAATFSSTLGINGVADNVKGGQYTATVSDRINFSGVTSVFPTFTRVGNVVVAQGAIQINPTTANTYTEFRINLPSGWGDAGTQPYCGSGTLVDGGSTTTNNDSYRPVSVSIIGNVAYISFYPRTTSTASISFSFQYILP
jgi:hypothetical protein